MSISLYVACAFVIYKIRIALTYTGNTGTLCSENAAQTRQLAQRNTMSHIGSEQKV